jgi:hypothetical protein
MNRPRLLDKFLKSSDSELEALVTHAQQLRRLQGLFRQAVAENLAKNCRVANYQNQQLTLSCQSAAWATRVNMEIPQLITRLRQTEPFRQLLKVRVITRPQSQLVEKKQDFRQIPMSGTSASIISDMADSMNDPALSAALRRLARHKNN